MRPVNCSQTAATTSGFHFRLLTHSWAIGDPSPNPSGIGLVGLVLDRPVQGIVAFDLRLPAPLGTELIVTLWAGNAAGAARALVNVQVPAGKSAGTADLLERVRASKSSILRPELGDVLSLQAVPADPNAMVSGAVFIVQVA